MSDEHRNSTSKAASDPSAGSGVGSPAASASGSEPGEARAVGSTWPEGGPHIRIEMISQARYLAGARSMIASVAQRFGFSECDCGQIALALDEALCNVIKHGYERRSDGLISISVWPENDPPTGICIQIDDRGRQVDVAAIRSRRLDDIRPGGLGVFLINQIMDDARYSKREGGGMRLTMIKHLDGDGCGKAGSTRDAGTASPVIEPADAACCGGEPDCDGDPAAVARCATQKSGPNGSNGPPASDARSRRCEAGDSADGGRPTHQS